MATPALVEEMYNNTVKFTSNNEYTEQGYTKKIWSINISNRGKYMEVKVNNKVDCDVLIQREICES